MAVGFIKLNRSEETAELMKDPKAFTLLCLVACRARRKEIFNKYDLEIGEALIGDHDTIGLTRQEYRTALAKLERWNFITIKATNRSTINPTIRGTVAKLSDTRVFDINEDVNQPLVQPSKQPLEQPITNQLPTMKKNEKEDNKNLYSSIISFLNAKANTKFKSSTRKTIQFIQARLNEGFTEEDFKKVIEKKTSDWLNDSKMNGYLRPRTLFGNNFEGYANEKFVAPISTKALTTSDIKTLFED